MGLELHPQVVIVLRRGSLRRGNAWSYYVRTHTSDEGWVFLQPSDLQDGCPAAWRR